MAGLLSNFRNTVILSVLLALVVLAGYYHHADHMAFLQGVFRWMHVFFGILWIGLLYYFNFVQIRVMPSIPAELKPAVSKYIAPEALFWFRWAALATWVMGIIMMVNVWAFIWPNQKIALGLVEADADAKAKAARLAMLFSRTNVLLSIPMLVTMTLNQTVFG